MAEIKRMEIARARIEVMDRTTKPFYRSEIFPLDFAATGVHWPGPAAKQVKLSAKTLEGGSLLVTGSLHPRGSDLSAKLEGLPLAPFNPYASGTGYSVGGGAAALESKIKFAGPKYDVNTHVVIHKLDVEGAQGDTLFLQRFGVPLELALALLTDVEGDIVHAPLSHDASGTSVGLGSIIGEALAHALLNAITSPLKLITAVAENGWQGGEPVAKGPRLPARPHGVCSRRGGACRSDRGADGPLAGPPPSPSGGHGLGG